MNPVQIVGVGGQAESGKDVISDHLANRLVARTNRPWGRVAFAAGVKTVFEDTFGVDRPWVERWKRIDEPPPGYQKTVRQMLIDIGDGFRTFRPDVWILRALNTKGSFVVSDARYLNEMRAIKARGGVTVALYRPDRENNNPNASERELRAYIQKFLDAGIEGPTGDDIVDVFIVNRGTIGELFDKADQWVVPAVAA